MPLYHWQILLFFQQEQVSIWVFTLFLNIFTLLLIILFFLFLVAAAPAIAVAASGGNSAVFSFGSTTSVDYDPWSTFPIIQLPSWSISAIYGIVVVFGAFYLFGILGTSIPGISTLSSAMSGKVSFFGEMILTFLDLCFKSCA